MKRDEMKSLEMLGCVRENWVSSLVRNTLAEPAPLSHLQVSPRREGGTAGAGWDGCCHEWCSFFPPFMQVPCANTGALRFWTEVVQQMYSPQFRLEYTNEQRP